MKTTEVELSCHMNIDLQSRFLWHRKLKRGSHEVWHGNADILVDQSVVKVERSLTEDEDGDADTLEYDAGEPARKRTRTESGGGEAGNSRDEEMPSPAVIEVNLSNNDYMPNGPMKISLLKCRPNETLSEVLAQTIVNAFLQVKKRKALEHYFIPSLLASDRFVTIHMYNPADDILLTQGQAMDLWQENGDLDQSVILCIWMALNMLHFSRCSPGQPDQSNFFEKSNFQALVGISLTEYQNNLEMPLGRHEDVSVNYSMLLIDSIYYMIKERKRLKRSKLEHNSRK